jgi:hypothetical protein
MMQIGEGSGHGNFRLLYLRYVPGETPQPRLSVAWYDSGFVTNFTPTQNQIYTFTYTDNGSNESKIYINGSLLTTYTSYTPLETNTNALYIGKFSYGGVLSGKVYNTKIYNRVLTPQEVIQNFESQRVNYGITGITTNGLVLNLDSGNNASYNGSGTTWIDTSSSRTDGILTNGPSYSSSGASSSISFDGSDDNVKIGNPESLQFNNATFSYGCWFYWSNTNTQATLMGKRDGANTVNVPGGSNYNQWGLAISETMCCGPAGKKLGGYLSCDGGNPQGGSLIADLPNSAGWIYGFVTINTTEQKLYINGILSSTTNLNFTGQTFKIVGRSCYVGATGGEFEGSIIGPFNNKISVAHVYNRTLSASEVLQNYNAQKSRFGL